MSSYYAPVERLAASRRRGDLSFGKDRIQSALAIEIAKSNFQYRIQQAYGAGQIERAKYLTIEFQRTYGQPIQLTEDQSLESKRLKAEQRKATTDRRIAEFKANADRFRAIIPEEMKKLGSSEVAREIQGADQVRSISDISARGNLAKWGGPDLPTAPTVAKTDDLKSAPTTGLVDAPESHVSKAADAPVDEKAADAHDGLDEKHDDGATSTEPPEPPESANEAPVTAQDILDGYGQEQSEDEKKERRRAYNRLRMNPDKIKLTNNRDEVDVFHKQEKKWMRLNLKTGDVYTHPDDLQYDPDDPQQGSGLQGKKYGRFIRRRRHGRGASWIEHERQTTGSDHNMQRRLDVMLGEMRAGNNNPKVIKDAMRSASDLYTGGAIAHPAYNRIRDQIQRAHRSLSSHKGGDLASDNALYDRSNPNYEVNMRAHTAQNWQERQNRIEAGIANRKLTGRPVSWLEREAMIGYNPPVTRLARK